MLELRKEIFADERDDNLKEIGKPTQRQDMIGHVTGTTALFRRPQARRPAAPEGAAQPASSRAHPPHRHERGRARAGRAPRDPRRRRAAQSQHAAEPAQLRQGRRAVARDRQGALQGRADRRRSSPTPSARRSRRCAKVRVDYEPLHAGVRRRGGAQARRAGGQRDLSEEHLRVSRQVRSPEAALRRRRARPSRQADHVLEQRYQMSPIEHAPTETNGSIAAPETNGRFVVYTCAQGLFFSLDTTAKILDVQSNKLHFIGGTVGGGFGGKVDSLTEPLATLGAMLTGRPVRYVLGREEEMQFGSPRGAERIYRQGRRDEGRAHHRAQGAQLFRQRRLYAAVELRRDQVRGAHSGAVHDPERRMPTSTASTPTACRRPRCAASASPAVDFAIECQMDKLAHLDRHGPDGVPHPQRLSRRRHEGAPARGEEHRADRMRAGRGREGELADPRRVQAHVLARRRRRRARRDPADAARRRRAGAGARRAAAHELRPAGSRAAAATPQPARPAAAEPPPPAPPPAAGPRRRPPTCSTARRASPPCSARRRR